MKFLKQYLYNLLLSYDQWINTILLGDPDESLSGRLGRAMIHERPKWWVKPMARANDLMWRVLAGEENHSLMAVEHEERPLEKELWSWVKNGD
jgi:hypothetical protein